MVNTKIFRTFEEKTITSSVNYGGFSYRLNLGNGLSYKMGNLKFAPVQSQEFILQENGKLVITNERLIFIGKKSNKTININNVLEFSLFKDGILIGKTNGKKPLIKFIPPYYGTESVYSNMIPNDDINIITRILTKLFN